MEHIQQREGRWVIVDMRGKGGRVRSVPMPSFAKAALDVWTQAAGLTAGRVFRAINKGDRLYGEGMTAQAIFDTMTSYAEANGPKGIAPQSPQEFRKNGAQRESRPGADPISLGHSSVQTTERYLGVEQDLQDAPCDHLGLKLSAYS
jgi:integrase